uniref:RAB17, member RAS oncogene family n=1 Tax=Felis catus TaxID=9685 RepID=A0ABI7X2L3_FELCA
RRFLIWGDTLRAGRADGGCSGHQLPGAPPRGRAAEAGAWPRGVAEGRGRKRPWLWGTCVEVFGGTSPRGGGAFFTKELELGAVAVKLEIWDTAGQEKYHSVCRLYFRGASGAILVYDITRRDSFCKAQQWLQDLEREAPPGEVVVMLVGNKTDVGERREVTFQEGKEFAESKKLLFMEASAKLNHQVTEVFSTIAQELLQREDRKKAQPQRGDAGLALKGAPAGQAGCCAH